MVMNMKVAPPPKSCLGVAKCNSNNNNNNNPLLQVGGTINPNENNDEKGKMMTSASSSSGRKASLITLEQLVNYECMHGHDHGHVDLTKLRKIISNRLSAQRCRNKKTQYIRDMEKKANDLQATISMLSPEIERYKEIQKGLMVENALLLQHLDTFTRKSNLLKEEMEAVQVEVNRLRVVHEAQKEQKLKALLMEEEFHLHAAQAAAASTMENWIGE